MLGMLQRRPGHHHRTPSPWPRCPAAMHPGGTPRPAQRCCRSTEHPGPPPSCAVHHYRTMGDPVASRPGPQEAQRPRTGSGAAAWM